MATRSKKKPAPTAAPTPTAGPPPTAGPTPSAALAAQLDAHIKSRATKRGKVAERQLSLGNAVAEAQLNLRDALREAGMLEYRAITTETTAAHKPTNDEYHKALAIVDMASYKHDALLALRKKVCLTDVDEARAGVAEMASRVNGTKRVQSLPAMPPYADAMTVSVPASVLDDD